MSNRWDNRSTPSFDSTYNFMELHVDRKKRNGYLVQYCMLEASKLILVSLSKIRKGKLTGESIFFDLSNNLEAVVDYLNGNRHGRFIRYDTNNDNKKYISLYMEYRKDRLNGTAIRVGKNNDTLYHRIYRRGKVVKRINEKYPNMYAD
ncbi:MAG: hypothetical protein JNJ58_10075 [Chitinophagaceae bacterium]|nr:hypothetical protein [Chitinophagaceae bacterium]